MKNNAFKKYGLLLFLISIIYSCSRTNEQERIVTFKLFNEKNKIAEDIESIKNNFKLLDDKNNDITNHQEFGIKMNDSTSYFSFKGYGENLIRKIVKENDTMLLYFKRRHKEDKTPKLSYTIDSLIFKKGKYLLDSYNYSYPLLHEALWSKYYNEYIDLTLKEKQKNVDYKKGINYKELSSMREKIHKSKYDYSKIGSLFNYFLFDRGRIYSPPFIINERKYSWEFSYKKPEKKGVIEGADVTNYNLVDLEKEEIILKNEEDIFDQTIIKLEYLESGKKEHGKFIDANFDGKKDFILGPNYRPTIYIYNEQNKSFDYLEYLAHGVLKIDSIQEKLIFERQVGRLGHEKTTFSFKKDGSLNIREINEKEVIKNNSNFYHIITKSKEIKESTHFKEIEKTIDTIKVKPDYWNYSFYQKVLKN